MKLKTVIFMILSIHGVDFKNLDQILSIKVSRKIQYSLSSSRLHEPINFIVYS